MKGIINTKVDLCTGCNRCVRECPMETANITYQNENKNIKVKIDHEKCIACGRCIAACKHNSRYYTDDIDIFFNDLKNGVPISLMTAPSIKTNIPEYKNIFTYLKKLGVKKIYDVSLGADICIWAYIRYMEKTNFKPIITQPCPAIVSYCKIYHHELLEKLSPVHSPIGCTSVYMKKYEGITDSIAVLSPCIAKSHEIEDTKIAEYNVTFAAIKNYLQENKISLPNEETDFDNVRTNMGSLFPMPGGLKENVEFYCGKKISIDRAEGYNVYKQKLNAYLKTKAESLPHLLDALNCDEGCNAGTAGINTEEDFFYINRKMDDNRKTAMSDKTKEQMYSVFTMYDSKLDLNNFLRKYESLPNNFKNITEKDIERTFVSLGKTTLEKQNIDCGACGSDTCYEMARKIALGVNIPLNCMKKEHEENITAHEKLVLMEKQREIDIKNSLQLAKLDLVVKGTKIALWDMEIDRDNLVNAENVFNWSNEFRQMLGFKDENDFPNVLRSWSDRLHPDDKERTLDAFAKHMADKTGKTPYDVEYKLQLKNGEYRYFRASGETIRDEEGNPLRVAGALMDITDAKNTLIETQRLKQEAEEANKAKSSFLSTMSHEIRTPMNAILGITEIQLQKENIDPSVKDALEKIYASGDLLLGIINDILDLSKIEAGKMELLIDKYEIASLISDTVQLNIMRIGSKPIEFELHVDENSFANLLGDELRVKQILNNLLSNAFKYTKKGKVLMTVSTNLIPSETASDNIALVISVEDTGQGMTQEQVDKLFDEYSRFNQAANRTTEGTGLGMAITRNLIHMMNGHIDIASEPGKGSVFTITIPQGKIDDERLGKEMTESLQQFRSSSRSQMKRAQVTRDPMPYGSVLIVDDVEINIYVARGLLTPYKLAVDSAGSGFIALEKIKNGNVYDIVFMDHMMPEMDGIETTRKIRELGYTNPIVALTANAVAGQADVFLGNGFDDFISKPIDVRQLDIILNKLIRDKQPTEVIEEARKQAEMEQNKNEDNINIEDEKIAQEAIYAEVFIRDAEKTVTVLELIKDKKGNYNDDDLHRFIIHVHGMKSALANIGRMELSAFALKLESLGRDGEIKIIEKEMPLFLEKLKQVIKELTPKEEDVAEMTDENKKLLCEQLEKIKEAFGNYDESTAEKIIEELRKVQWPNEEKKLLSDIASHLLHSDFDKGTEAVSKYIDSHT